MELKERLKQVLEGNGGNYIFPFFWQRGEEESVLRDYMRAIREADVETLSAVVPRAAAEAVYRHFHQEQGEPD